MRPDEHRRMFAFEDHYWWFVGRQAIIRAILETALPPAPDRLILDLGCGSGATLKVLDGFGRAVGLDPFRIPLQFSRQRGCRRLLQADALRLPFEPGTFELVTAFDVIEHIADDRAALAEVQRALRPGGRFLMTVPAYQWLWSHHDEALDHYRRYTAGQVRQRLTEVGLTVERLGYCITLLLPAAVILRLSERLRPRPREAHAALIELPPLLNRLCLLTLHLEARLLRRVNLPWGVSVIALARK